MSPKTRPPESDQLPGGTTNQTSASATESNAVKNSIPRPNPTATQAPLETALSYAAKGFPVVPIYPIESPAPADIVAQFRAGTLGKKEAQAHAVCGCDKPDCPSPGKHPILDDGVNGATTDADQIRKWWTEYPDMYVGIRMPLGVVALDFDLYEPGVQERLDALRTEGLPETLTQDSGAGGLHMLFTCDPATKFGSTLDSTKGIDLIHNAHRYLVAAPSGHWTGGTYAWANTLEPVAAPAWLMSRCARGASKQRAKPVSRPVDKPKSVQGYTPKWLGVQPAQPPSPWLCPADREPADWAVHVAQTIPPAIANDEEGSEEHGHVTLKRAAGHLIAGLGLGEDLALNILWEHFNPRCVPPWDDSDDARDGMPDFERTVRGAGDGLEAGYLLKYKAAKPAPDNDVSDTAAAPAEPAPATATAKPNPLGVPQDFSAPDVPLDYLCPGLHLAPSTGKISVISGAPGAGKGPMADHLAICFALGLKAFEVHDCKQVNVLLLDKEGARLTMRRIRRMARALGREPGDLIGRLHVFDSAGAKMLDAEFEEALRSYVAEHEIGVVVLDAYTSAMLASGVDANSPDYASLAGLLAQLGVLVITVNHFNKAGALKETPQLGDMAYTGALATIAQTAIAVTRPDPKDPHVVRVTCLRAPEGAFDPFDARYTNTADNGLRLALCATVDPAADEQAKADRAAAKHAETVAKRADTIERSLKGVATWRNANTVRTNVGMNGTVFPEALALCFERGTVEQNPIGPVDKVQIREVQGRTKEGDRTARTVVGYLDRKRNQKAREKGGSGLGQ